MAHLYNAYLKTKSMNIMLYKIIYNQNVPRLTSKVKNF